MTLVVDTNILVDVLRDRRSAVVELAARAGAGERLTASTLTKVEILAGMRPGEEPATYTLFDALEWVPVTDAIAERAGQLARTFARSHPGIEVVDYAIAATARELGAELWTTNVRHFPMFPDLEAPY